MTHPLTSPAAGSALIAVDYTGSSMHPLLPSRATLLCRPAGRARVGDIVLLASGDALVAHRLIGWRRTPGETLMLTAGDNRAWIDPPLSPDSAVGTVCEVLARGRRLQCERPLARAGFDFLAALMRVCLRDAPPTGTHGGAPPTVPLPVRVAAHLLRRTLWGLAPRDGL